MEGCKAKHCGLWLYWTHIHLSILLYALRNKWHLFNMLKFLLLILLFFANASIRHTSCCCHTCCCHKGKHDVLSWNSILCSKQNSNVNLIYDSVEWYSSKSFGLEVKIGQLCPSSKRNNICMNLPVIKFLYKCSHMSLTYFHPCKVRGFYYLNSETSLECTILSYLYTYLFLILVTNAVEVATWLTWVVTLYD